MTTDWERAAHTWRLVAEAWQDNARRNHRDLVTITTILTHTIRQLTSELAGHGLEDEAHTIINDMRSQIREHAPQ